LDSVSVGSIIVASDGMIHLAVEVNASDSSSGLNQKFVLEITSPSGASLQQWATFDANGHAIVDFSLSPYSASGDYHINTIRLTDLAGNYNDSRSWLNANSTPIIITNPNQDIIAPEIKNFSLEAVFDPITDRPKIVISGVVTDDISGVKGVYLRMNSPAGSNAFLDTWVYADYYSQPGTNQKTVQLDSYKALTTDFLPGEYSVDFLRLGDAANNQVYLYGYDLSAQSLQKTVRVYFPDPLHNSGQTKVNASEKSDFVFGSDKLDDHLFANAGDDIIYSGLGNDVVDAGAGDDLIVGGNGEGDDTYVGGDGFDTIKYTSAVADITVDLLNGTAFATAGADAAHIGRDSLSSIEGIIAGNYNDTLIGNDVNNDINGEAGNDTITGGGGNDTIDGGDGSDTAVFSGTYANYTKFFNSVTNQYTLIANLGNDGTDIVSNVEFFMFSDTTVAATSLLNPAPTLTAFAAALASGNEDNQVQVTFSDLLSQGNEADVDGTVDAFVIKAVSTGTLLIGTSAGTATDWNASTNNTIDATHVAYWTPAANANGTLNAFIAVAKDNGGLESATPVQATVSVTSVNDAPTGSVTISGTATQGQILTASNSLADADGMGTLTYTWYTSESATPIGTGNTFTLTQAQVGKNITVVASYTDLQGTTEFVDSNALQVPATPPVATPIVPDSKKNVIGTSSPDVIDGTSNSKLILVGGAGDDIYIVNNTKAKVTETSGNGSDTVYSSVTFVLGNNLENLVLMGNSNINAKGNSLNNNLIGNNGNNIVDGQAGNDILDGRSGNDTLIGGIGSDTFIISSGTDAIMDLGLGGDSLQVSLGATVNATIKSAWTASSDTLNEGAVSITTKGFAVNVSASTGSDGYSILNTGSASSLVGSAAGDSLKGGKGNDLIIGNAGNDFIYGGAGKDILTGGSGSDTFIFNTTPNKSSNIDTLTDFSSGVDKLQFDKAIFKSIGSTGTLNADAFYANAGATSGHDTTDRFVYNTTSGYLYYDADGSGKNVAVQIALIGVASHPDLVVTDFIVA